VPLPSGDGWIEDGNGKMQMQWTVGNIIPDDIVDILAYEREMRIRVKEASLKKWRKMTLLIN